MSEGNPFNIVRLAGKNIDLCTLRDDSNAIKSYVRWLNDEEINHFIGKNRSVISYSEEYGIINKKLQEHRPDEYSFSIIVKETDDLIGNCSLNVAKDRSNGVLGILIGEKKAWNKGYGREAINLMCKYGFNELNLHRIELTVLASNDRARKCYSSCGLKECGCDHEAKFHHGSWDDLIHMEILNPDHKRPKSE